MEWGDIDGFWVEWAWVGCAAQQKGEYISIGFDSNEGGDMSKCLWASISLTWEYVWLSKPNGIGLSEIDVELDTSEIFTIQRSYGGRVWELFCVLKMINRFWVCIKIYLSVGDIKFKFW